MEKEDREQIVAAILTLSQSITHSSRILVEKFKGNATDVETPHALEIFGHLPLQGSGEFASIDEQAHTFLKI